MSTTQPARQTVANDKLLMAAVIAALAAGVVNLILFFLLPALFNITLRVGMPGAPLEPLPLVVMLVITMLPAFLGAGLLWLLGRFTSRPFTIFWVIAIVVLILSYGAPLNLGIPTNEVLALSLMHTAAAIIITFVLTTRARG
jgi:hypothetical protein